MSEQNKKTVGARIKRVFRNHASEFSMGSALLVICIVLT